MARNDNPTFASPTPHTLRLVAICTLLAFTAMHWVGLRAGSVFTQVISAAMGLQFLVLLLGCFLVPLATHSVITAPPAAAPALLLLSMGMIIALVPAVRGILTAYDGW